ncbi:MAG: aminomethyl-transferring glycine dehydrogenase subunit GcvPA [Alphaproteobacteria bacterium]|jgi:glycine dehydrogenase subunit 1|nr:aminomethyl-transferring glycine dehydrogenase subunit GcvPA [Alphaproteobacteria bacterium]MDP7223516.1 aminomethyl-transferring glycine dehydrogenase subunit GcvPA [Alphaproteobacteria bacterium]
MRYLSRSKTDRQAMLDAIGCGSVDDLFADVPKQAFVDGKVDLPDHAGELEVERDLTALAGQNMSAADAPFFLGAGCYHHHIPSTVDYIIQRSEYLTAYTPYQPEIAQGTLTAIFEFQTYIALLTGQDIANASLYDGATAMTEAALMAQRVTKRRNVLLANDIHPEYVDVLTSYMKNYDDVTVRGQDDALDETVACVIVQSPDFFGCPAKHDAWRKKCDEVGALLVVVVTEILSLGLLSAPVQADIVCGEAQSIGLPMSFGGPHLGFFATSQKYLRQIPGRLCGETVDQDGKRSFVLTLNTREQHIRREKATSNICTNQGLCALAFTVHMSLLGEDGFKQLARLNHEAACRFVDAVAAIDGVEVLNEHFFNEVTLQLPVPSKDIVKEMAAQGVIAGLAADGNKLVCAVTEMVTDRDIEVFCNTLQSLIKG